MTGTVEVHGLRELREALTRKIPAEMQGKVLQQALAAGARPIVAEARRRAPKREGILRRALTSFRMPEGSNGVREERGIRPRQGKRFQKSRRDAFYWRFIEFGRAAVESTSGKSLGTPKKGFFGKRVKAVPAKPFLRPAFMARRYAALEAIRKGLAKSIEKAAKKAAWGRPRR